MLLKVRILLTGYMTSSGPDRSIDGGDGAVLDGYLDQSSEIQDVWSQMELHVSQAKALVFVGYSFPVGDLYFSSILRSVIAGCTGLTPGVVIVNPDAVQISSQLQSRFSLKAIVRYFDMDQFVRTTRKSMLDLLEPS